ncbi:MAG: FAD-binding oxidoreductase [Chitinophagaceae bacterium]
MKKKHLKGRISLAVLLIFLLLAGRPIVFLTWHYFTDQPQKTATTSGTINDASRENETPVDTVIAVAPDAAAAEKQLQELVLMARREGKKISIAGSQHSMGGHTMYPHAIVLNMKTFKAMQLDTVQNLLTVGAGATWADIIPYLDKYRRSVLVMQSNNSFTVGGSISVNCHGWQPNTGPIASTVASFRILTADGNIVTCSREKNQELFSLVLGGYGLSGVIVEVTLKVTANRAYRMQQYVFPSDQYIVEFDKIVNSSPEPGMVYGRLNVNPDNFLNEAMITVFRTDSSVAIPELKDPGFDGLRRTVFRSSANSDYGKKLRWRMEKWSSYFSKGKLFSRNQLLDEPVTVFQNTREAYTDILHEYFIPKDSVNSFISAMKVIVPRYKVDLMNITIRNVKQDNDVLLRYARKEVFGFVMLYNQQLSKEGEQDMMLFTRKMIDTVLAMKGTYYLPYRLHATREQFYRAYPMAAEFFALKRKYDTTELFENLFYSTYR